MEVSVVHESILDAFHAILNSSRLIKSARNQREVRRPHPAQRHSLRERGPDSYPHLCPTSRGHSLPARIQASITSCPRGRKGPQSNIVEVLQGGHCGGRLYLTGLHHSVIVSTACGTGVPAWLAPHTRWCRSTRQRRRP